MTILYRTAKFKSANIFMSAALEQTAKFKDCQYFWLYGITNQSMYNHRRLWFKLCLVHKRVFLDNYVITKPTQLAAVWIVFNKLRSVASLVDIICGQCQ